jgi:large subunit ribosomal protein L6
MSRVGKKPILIPQGIDVKIEGQTIKVSGPKGELSREIRPEIKIDIKDEKILLHAGIETKKNKALWGLSRALLANMLKGVNEGYEKKLEIQGLGYKAQLSEENLLLYVGYSHPVEIKAPPGIKFSVDKNIITVSGIDKELVGETSAVIRRMKPPEPYKGKGIKYLGEKIKKKMGKKAVAAGTK